MPLTDEAMADQVLKAVWSYAAVRIDQLARTVIRRVRRLPASGIFGDDTDLHSVWDEFRHNRQKGPAELLEEAFETTIFPFCRSAAETLTEEERRLLWFATDRFLDWPDDELEASSDTDAVAIEIWKRVKTFALD